MGTLLVNFDTTFNLLSITLVTLVAILLLKFLDKYNFLDLNDYQPQLQRNSKLSQKKSKICSFVYLYFLSSQLTYSVKLRAYLESLK